ncbi:hypothetical protein ACFFOS_15885 [Nocardioides kongjuensis]|uniref:Uncharacterized protein n=1 Tax=Nocardioides kongjuensis TaxID=349522 RepID=A0A852RG81_9ACTN|nr:hypothetical protein [Nocardioides kongjuensis]NYD32337.1 hypothetical protein [Nocardioides kongjuensis]
MNGRTSRVAGAAVPAALLVYAGSRWLDGRDLQHGPGLWWNLGHSAFLVSWVAFAVLAVATATAPVRPRRVARGAGVATLAGIGAFTWVSLADLFPGWPELPDPLRVTGPLLFLGGLVVLLAVTARARGRGPWLAFPLLALAAAVVVSADLDLLAVSAVLFGVALVPAWHGLGQQPVGASAPASDRSASGATR